MLPTKKNKVRPPAYGQVISMLRNLRVKYVEHDKDSPLFHITIPLFGVLLRFVKGFPNEASYRGWDIIDLNIDDLNMNYTKATEELLWNLIGKGYFAYLRTEVVGGEGLYTRYLRDYGWGEKIINKRLEYWGQQQKYKYLVAVNNKVKALNISQAMTHYPGFFDWLY